MKKQFSNLLSTEMSTNDSIRVLVADAGFGILDQIRVVHNDRFYNVGRAEQLLVGMGVGLADAGLIPVCYARSILYKPFELLQKHVDQDNTPVKLIDTDYNDGKVLGVFSNIQVFKPTTIEDLKRIWPEFIKCDKPAYLNLV